MACVQYGAMVSNLAGKIGGQNFQRGRASAILRNISTKKQFQKSIQLAPATSNVKGKFAYATQYWKTLSNAHRAAWAAVTASFPRINKFGVSYTPSAFQLFVELTQGLLLSGGNPVAAAPTVSTFVAPTWSIAYAGGGGDIIITQSVLFTSAPYKTIMSGAFYQSPGQACRPSFLKILAAFQFTAGSPSFVISTAFYAVYGSAIVGSVAFFSVKQINLNTGEINKPLFLQVNF